MGRTWHEADLGLTPGTPLSPQKRAIPGESSSCAHSYAPCPPGSDAAKPFSKKKFVSHTTCQDALELQEHETYLIMGRVTDLWRIQYEYVRHLPSPSPSPCPMLRSKNLLASGATLQEGPDCNLHKPKDHSTNCGRVCFPATARMGWWGELHTHGQYQVLLILLSIPHSTTATPMS